MTFWLPAARSVSQNPSGTIYATGNAGAILKKNGVDATSLKEAPEAWPVKKPRIGIYQPWSGNIDEGWTRWILEQFHFPFTVLHNADVRTATCASAYDTIVIAEMATRQIMDGHARRAPCRGSMRAASARPGAQALRDFVDRRRHAGHAGQRRALRHRAIQPAGDQRAGRLAAGPVLLLRLAAARRNPGPDHPVVAGLPLGSGGDVRAQPGVRHAARFPRQGAGQLM